MKKVLLIILDGFGLNPNKQENPIFSTETQVLDNLVKSFPKTSISASAENVGLSWGEVGNSEVGHSNLGTGQLVWQNAEKIDQMIKDGSFFQNKTLISAINHVKANHSNLHFLGLCSTGGIHSKLNHLLALLELAKDKEIENVFVHAITDGRDTKAKTCLKFLRQIDKKLEMFDQGKISTICGRYYAMDRDNRWHRTEAAYKVITGQENKNVFRTPIEAVEASYKKGLSDENLKPSVVSNGELTSNQFVRDDDAVIFFNFRADRARQITKAFVKDDLESEVKGFRRKKIKNLFFATMTPYETDWKVHLSVVFEPEVIGQPLSEILSKNDLTQFHTAETEKFAHVTYFFNGARERPERGEKQKIIPSPKVKSYEVRPQMSIIPLVNNLLEEMRREAPDFVLINFANPDMVGHTGNFKAAARAIYFCDKSLGQLLHYAKNYGYTALVTADHGNIEQMINPLTLEIDKEHTVNPVPFIKIDSFEIKKIKRISRDEHERIWTSFPTSTPPSGILADVPVTVLKLFGIPKPDIYSGEDLEPSLR